MVEYQCAKCSKRFNKKSNYDNHLNRKYPCKQMRQAKTDSLFNNQCSADSDYLSPDSDSSSVELAPENLLKVNKSLSSVSKIKTHKNMCNYCGDTFSQCSSLYRHLNYDRCKIKKQQDNNKEELFKLLIKERKQDRKELVFLKQKVKEQDKIISTNMLINGSNINNSNINNGNINYNTVNNIKVVAFGKEDLSHLDYKDWLKIFRRNYKSIEELALLTHFDKNKPENQNIYISNLRSKYIMIHDGKRWIVKNKKETVDDMYDEKAYIIFNKVDELTDKLPISIVDKFDKIRTDYDTDEIRKALIKDIDITLYNQRNIPIYTHKPKEKQKIE